MDTKQESELIQAALLIAAAILYAPGPTETLTRTEALDEAFRFLMTIRRAKPG